MALITSGRGLKTQVAATSPGDEELYELLQETRAFEESLADRFAAMDLALQASGGGGGGGRPRSSSRGMSISRTGSRGRAGSFAGRASVSINWTGVISQVAIIDCVNGSNYRLP